MLMNLATMLKLYGERFDTKPCHGLCIAFVILMRYGTIQLEQASSSSCNALLIEPQRLAHHNPVKCACAGNRKVCFVGQPHIIKLQKNRHMEIICDAHAACADGVRHLCTEGIQVAKTWAVSLIVEL
jgi:hypothetical protein